jgi:hypothetical protein
LASIAFDLLLEQGAYPKMVQELQGDANIDIVAGRDCYVLPTTHREAAGPRRRAVRFSRHTREYKAIIEKAQTHVE